MWLDDVFGVKKPVIAMLHLMALPGDPGFDSAGGMKAIVDRARRELDALQSGGVDAVMFSNEFSLPYLTKTEPITSIAMARVIGELLSEIKVPFGVNVLWDGMASIELATGTGAKCWCPHRRVVLSQQPSHRASCRARRLFTPGHW